MKDFRDSKYSFHVCISVSVRNRDGLSILSVKVRSRSICTSVSVSDPMNLELLLSRTQCPASVASVSRQDPGRLCRVPRDRNWSYRLSTARNRMYWISKLHECSHPSNRELCYSPNSKHRNSQIPNSSLSFQKFVIISLTIWLNYRLIRR